MTEIIIVYLAIGLARFIWINRNNSNVMGALKNSTVTDYDPKLAALLAAFATLMAAVVSSLIWPYSIIRGRNDRHET